METQPSVESIKRLTNCYNLIFISIFLDFFGFNLITPLFSLMKSEDLLKIIDILIKFIPLILPLYLLLAEKKDQFLIRNVKRLLNFIITLYIALFVETLLIFLFIFLLDSQSSGGLGLLGITIMAPLIIFIVLPTIGFGIKSLWTGTKKAKQGQDQEYRFSIPIFR